MPLLARLALLAPIVTGLLLSSCNGTRSLRLENDIGDLQNDYNHGTELRWWLPEDEAGPLGRSFARLGLVETLGGPRTPETESVVRLRLGQLMFVPVDIARKIPDPRDRPYAGWLHAGIAAERMTLDPDESRRHDRRSLVELDLGIIGPSSLSDEVQTNWHDFWGLTPPNGWDAQLQDEPALLFSVQRDRRLAYVPVGEAHAWDLAGHVDWSLGNLKTEAVVGGALRFGKNLPRDFVLRTAPAGAGGGSLFTFADLRYVAQDLFLDGNTWRDGPSVDKRPLVGEFGVGFDFDIKSLHLRLAHIWRSKEFYGQNGTRAVWVLELGI
jgi:hypothetical protein